MLSAAATSDLPDESAASTSRYAILGDDLTQLEDTLSDLGIHKVKSFKHFSGIAVSLTSEEANDIRSILGREFQVIRDTPIQATFDLERTKGGGGGKPGGGGTSGQQIPWGINAVNAPAAWQTTRGEGVAVCVVDSGLDSDHPDLAGNIIAGANYFEEGNGGGISWEDETGHGTHVAGIIAALDNEIGIVGVAPEAKLISSKVFGRRGSATGAEAADAIRGCESMRDTFAPTSDLVVNMSFTVSGTEARELVGAAIQELHARGVMFAASTGNWGSPCIGHPARLPEVFGISGINEDLSFWEDSAIGSYPGSGLEDHCPSPQFDPSFTAPASNVLSLWKGGGTRTLDGTSMATAFASGVLALGLSAGSAGPVAVDLGFPHYIQGAGLIDAELTVQNVAAALAGAELYATGQSDNDTAESRIRVANLTTTATTDQVQIAADRFIPVWSAVPPTKSVDESIGFATEEDEEEGLDASDGHFPE